MISTNGYFTDRIIQAANRFGNRIGVRISLEGFPRPMMNCAALKTASTMASVTLTSLKAMGIKDIGFGITVSDRNATDMIELYRLADAMGLEFATAVTHNSFYFHKDDNQFDDQAMIADEFEKVALALLQTNRPKLFCAYFNMGLANKVLGGKRPLPCEVGTDMFFVDPYGNVVRATGRTSP